MGVYVIVRAILSLVVVLAANMLSAKEETAAPFVGDLQLSYCTTLDEDVVPVCAGIHAVGFLMADGNLVLPIKFPASQYTFIRDRAAADRIVYR